MMRELIGERWLKPQPLPFITERLGGQLNGFQGYHEWMCRGGGASMSRRMFISTGAKGCIFSP
jgi:hypothetical protein